MREPEVGHLGKGLEAPKQEHPEEEYITLLGAKIHRYNRNQILTQIELLLDGVKSKASWHILTLNAELLYQAQFAPELLQIINQADLVTPDGSGIVWASHTLGNPLSERVTGIDLAVALAQMAAEKALSVYLLGGQPGVASEAAAQLQQKFPALKIVGVQHGYFAAESAEEQRILWEIKEKQPDILLVALGAPKQEIWIQKHLEQGDLTVPINLGVGGTFDVWSGRVRRAPQWMQRWHLEWFGRLLREPWRWRRMLVLPKFMWLVWKRKYRNKGK